MIDSVAHDFQNRTIQASLDTYIERFDDSYKIWALVDMLEQRELRRLLTEYFHKPNLFICHSYLQSMLRQRKIVCRYQKDLEKSLGIIEVVYRMINKHLQDVVDDPKLCRPNESDDHLLRCIIFFEDLVKLGELEEVNETNHEALVDVMQNRLRLAVARRFNSKKALSPENHQMIQLLQTLNTLDCLRPWILPLEREELDAYRTEYSMQYRASDEYREFQGRRLDLPSICQPGYYSNWVVTFIPKHLFWILDMSPNLLSEMLHRNVDLLPLSSDGIKRMVALPMPPTPTSCSSGIESLDGYMLWLAFKVTAQHFFTNVLVEDSSLSKPFQDIEHRGLFVIILMCSFRLFEQVDKDMLRLKGMDNNIYHHYVQRMGVATMRMGTQYLFKFSRREPLATREG